MMSTRVEMIVRNTKMELLLGTRIRWLMIGHSNYGLGAGGARWALRVVVVF